MDCDCLWMQVANTVVGKIALVMFLHPFYIYVYDPKRMMPGLE